MKLFPLLALSVSAAQAFAADPVSIPLPGDGGWDYVTADSVARRLYVTHGTRVHAVDLDTQKLLGEIAPTPGVHGVALASEIGKGFISNGGDSTVTVFDTKTLRKTASLKVDGSKPDAILFEPFTKRVFAFNGGSDNTTAFDVESGKTVGSLDLGGGPEFGVSDGAGNAFVNIEDKGETVRFDPAALKVTARWSLAPAHTPTGLALDAEAHRLFVGCRSKHLVVLDSNTGNKLATLPIGAGVDAVALDTAHARAFVSCGDGTVSVIAWNKDGKFLVDRVINTEPGAKTLAYDSKTQRLYLPVAKRDGKNLVPDSFQLFVVDVAEAAK